MTWINKNTVIYQILIDRFARPRSDTRNSEEIADDTPVFCGGAIRGIIERFEHLKNLGINTIWISPFCKGESFHGYHPTDLYSVDSRFGTEDDLQELITLVHNNGMKIVADFVPNHVSFQHPFFISAQEDSKSEYKNWFYFKTWPKEYKSFLDIDILPKLNLDYRPARDHVIGAARKWLTLGFDGFRLDHIPGPSDDFWKEFIGKLSAEFPQVEFIGEAWLFGVKFAHLKTLCVTNKYLAWIFGTPFLVAHYQKHFPTLFLLDFEFNAITRGYAAKNFSKETLLIKLKPWVNSKNQKLLTFLDNHDMNRFLHIANGDVEKLKEVAEVQFSLPCPVIVYQGTEFGMTHEKSMESYSSYGDLVARKIVPWHEKDGKLFYFYKNLIYEKTQNLH